VEVKANVVVTIIAINISGGSDGKQFPVFLIDFNARCRSLHLLLAMSFPCFPAHLQVKM
jgi:hypothetical protein